MTYFFLGVILYVLAIIVFCLFVIAIIGLLMLGAKFIGYE